MVKIFNYLLTKTRTTYLLKINFKKLRNECGYYAVAGGVGYGLYELKCKETFFNVVQYYRYSENPFTLTGLGHTFYKTL